MAKNLVAAICATASLSTLALALALLLSPSLARANYATGTWDPNTTDCSCPTWYNGCKCVV